MIGLHGRREGEGIEGKGPATHSMNPIGYATGATGPVPGLNR